MVGAVWGPLKATKTAFESSDAFIEDSRTFQWWQAVTSQLGEGEGEGERCLQPFHLLLQNLAEKVIDLGHV